MAETWSDKAQFFKSRPPSPTAWNIVYFLSIIHDGNLCPASSNSSLSFWRERIGTSFHTALKSVFTECKAKFKISNTPFTVVCIVTWPMNVGEAGGDLSLTQTSLLFHLMAVLFKPFSPFHFLFLFQDRRNCNFTFLWSFCHGKGGGGVQNHLNIWKG